MNNINANHKNVDFYSITYWDVRLSWASTFFFIGSMANASLKTILPISESIWGPLSILFGVFIIGGYLLYSKEVLRRSHYIFWRTVSLFVILYVISAVLILLRGESLKSMIIGNVFLTFAWWIPSGIYACSVIEKKILYDVWVKASYILSLMAIIIFFFHIPTEKYEGAAEYNMSFGFYIILPTLIQINEFCKNKRFWLFFLILFEIFTILVYANRGILLSLVFFVVYKFAFESESTTRKVIAFLILLLVSLLLLSSIQSIATVAVAILDSFGFESRTIGMLADGIIDETTGRDAIWKYCFQMIEDKPILGWGLGGEYHQLSVAITGSNSVADDPSCSPHNGIIQNFVNFGILGGIISTMIILIPIFYLRKVRDNFCKALILIFCASRVIPNLVSGDGFFIEPKVAIYLYLFYFWKHGIKIKLKMSKTQ